MAPPAEPRVAKGSEMEESENSTQSDSSDEDDELLWHETAKGPDVPSEYWHIQKLIKYMKAGNQTATIMSLCCLKDHDLTAEINLTAIRDTGGLEVLVNLLETDDFKCKVLTNAVGGLAECAKFPHNQTEIRTSGGIPKLIMLLNGNSGPMLENVCRVLGECANEMESMEIIDMLDGVRLIWSQLKHPSPAVQASAAWALCPCIQNARDSGKMVRSFVGGLELIVSRLKSTDANVLACVCAALAKIAQDKENLAVITDHDVVPMLAQLVVMDEDVLKEHLAEAIAYCCDWGVNCREFGRLGAITPLVNYMNSEDKNVHRTTAYALHQLSADPYNCVTMHQSGVVPFLLKTIGSSDEKLQEASAGCLSNIRKLALTAENFNCKQC